MIIINSPEVRARVMRLDNEVREKLRPALLRANAVHIRNEQTTFVERWPQAITGRAVSEQLINHLKVRASETEVLEALARLTGSDKNLRGWHTSVGYGDGLDKWMWALPLEFVGD